MLIRVDGWNYPVGLKLRDARNGNDTLNVQVPTKTFALISQKYVIVLAYMLFAWNSLLGQCLMTADAFEQRVSECDRIIEGKVVGQQAFIGEDGNVYTSNRIDVFRTLKGQPTFSVDVVTEGGIYGDLMQVVTPSAQMPLGSYGLLMLANDEQRSLPSLLTGFYPIDDNTGNVYGAGNMQAREQLYEAIAAITGTEVIQLHRLPESTFHASSQNSRTAPSIEFISPMQVTAGTQTVVTISGQGFGEQQGNGFVAFRNADDGGQSFVALSNGPHYLSWSDTQIELYVPSATLYNTTVAGTGNIRVVTDQGQSVESVQQLRVEYAKSEVIFSDAISNTVLVGMQGGGYLFHANHILSSQLSMTRISNSLTKWACNTGVNFTLAEDLVSASTWSHDGINLLGMSEAGQLPSYLLGKTITTFSGCGTPNGLQWNLIEVDIILNRDIEWWTEEGTPMANRFDLETVLLHELGHAHLLQHNNDESSPMFFQLTAGSMRRTLLSPSIEGGSYVSSQSAQAASTCSEELHQYFDTQLCDLSLINSVEEDESEDMLAYPNPFSETLFIKVDGPSYFQIIDATGRSVIQGTVQSTAQSIDTGELRVGIYTLVIVKDGSSSSLKLLKN